MRGHCAANDPEADHTNVLMRWVRRSCEALHGGVIYDQTAGKRRNRQSGSLKNDEARMSKSGAMTNDEVGSIGPLLHGV